MEEGDMEIYLSEKKERYDLGVAQKRCYQQFFFQSCVLSLISTIPGILKRVS